MNEAKDTREAPAEDITLTCTHCGRRIEFCSFCDRTECPAACCYGCLVVTLGESKPPLHVHGG